MSAKLVSVTADEPVERIAQLMQQHGIRRVLIVRDGHEGAHGHLSGGGQVAQHQRVRGIATARTPL